MCGKMGDMSEEYTSKEASAFEASKEALAETGCIDMAGERRHERAGDRSGAIAGGRPQDSHWDRLVCGSDRVSEDTVADDFPMLQSPGKAKSHRPASGKLLPNPGIFLLRLRVAQRFGGVSYEHGEGSHFAPPAHARLPGTRPVGVC